MNSSSSLVKARDVRLDSENSQFFIKKTPVVSMNFIAKEHEQRMDKVKTLFNRHQSNMEEGADYFFIPKEDILNPSSGLGEIRSLLTNNRQQGVFFFTESGYLKIIKPMQDKKAWDVYKYVVKEFLRFKKEEQSKQKSTNVNPNDWRKQLSKEEAKRSAEITKDWQKKVVHSAAKVRIQTAYYHLYSQGFDDPEIRKPLMTKPQLRYLANLQDEQVTILGHVSQLIETDEDVYSLITTSAQQKHALSRGDADEYLQKSFEIASKIQEAQALPEPEEIGRKIVL